MQLYFDEEVVLDQDMPGTIYAFTVKVNGRVHTIPVVPTVDGSVTVYLATEVRGNNGVMTSDEEIRRKTEADQEWRENLSVSPEDVTSLGEDDTLRDRARDVATTAEVKAQEEIEDADKENEFGDETKGPGKLEIEGDADLEKVFGENQ